MDRSGSQATRSTQAASPTGSKRGRLVCGRQAPRRTLSNTIKKDRVTIEKDRVKGDADQPTDNGPLTHDDAPAYPPDTE